MIETASIARALRRIEGEVASLVAEARDHGHAIDPHALHCVALKLGCQAEMLERELVE